MCIIFTFYNIIIKSANVAGGGGGEAMCKGFLTICGYGWEGGGGQAMWIIIKFYNIILKSANVDKGQGSKTLIHKMWKNTFFLTPTK